MAEESKLAYAASLLRQNRWGSGVKCPHCLSEDVNKNGIREDFIQQYRCLDCDKSFNDRTGSVFDKTKMNLYECFLILEMSEIGHSVRAISEEVDRSWRAVDNFLKHASIRVNLHDISGRYFDEREESYPEFGCGNKEFKSHLQDSQLM